MGEIPRVSTLAELAEQARILCEAAEELGRDAARLRARVRETRERTAIVRAAIHRRSPPAPTK